MSYLHEGSVWWELIASGKVGQLGKLHGEARHKQRTLISSTFSSFLFLISSNCHPYPLHLNWYSSLINQNVNICFNCPEIFFPDLRFPKVRQRKKSSHSLCCLLAPTGALIVPARIDPTTQGRSIPPEFLRSFFFQNFENIYFDATCWFEILKLYTLVTRLKQKCMYQVKNDCIWIHWIAFADNEATTKPVTGDKRIRFLLR